MDLRGFIKDDRLVERARQLVIRGLLNYQPWIFADRLETGVGLEWLEQTYVGLVYYPDIDQGLLQSPDLQRLVIDPARYAQFHAANARLRRLYDGIVDEVSARLGTISTLSFLDVGCNTGYMPQSFAKRGARRAGGCDREPGFAETFALLNEILGTRAAFHASGYDPRARAILGIEPHDIVLSMAVLCHQAEPLCHLAALASVARVGVFAWTLVNDDPGYTIHLGEPKGHYKEDVFPLCFDRDTTLSFDLFKRSFELLGFKEIQEIPSREAGLPEFSWHGAPLRGLLALR